MRRRLIGGIGVLVLQAVMPAALAIAASTTASPGQGLEISPPVLELSADPGQSITIKIQVRDVSSGELIAKGQADDFGASTSEDGKPQLLLNETGETRYSLKYWVSSVPDLDLQPKELKTALITINVPANAEPGGHYGVIRFTAVPPNVQGTGVALSASIGTLVLLRVNGAVKDKVDLTQFSSNNPLVGARATNTTVAPRSFFETGPIGFTVRVHDTGTVHEVVKGSITITDSFDHKVAVLPVNASSGNVLPDSIRRFDETYSQKGLFGHYTAALNLTYLHGTKQLTSKISFWVIPWKFILAVLFALIILVYLIKIGLKKYNAHIIASARK